MLESSKIVRVCETKKILNRIHPLMKGKGLLIGRDIDKIEFDGLEFLGLYELTRHIRNSGLSPSEEIKKYFDLYDYVIFVCFEYQFEDNLFVSKMLKNVISFTKSNGFSIFYFAHPFYFPAEGFSNNHKYIPHDILVRLKQVHEHSMEILDYQTYCFDGAYGSQNHEEVEYGFQIVIKKANDIFSKKKNLEDDPGQLESLDD